ncbi:hypothetical protein NPIL_150961 [Nephila pilipes]|uniref:Uncharacterized protein n=1 Tax=Nephila pilipes TaxID=299642 RepID=A0A8X6PZS7_NEPPI|nr:hypothetical protein NPIL_653071 [Nephila pilipes]GFT86391.1 hypothetical protein NPIL_314851 [Nephila pilipes]GFT94661.1 hypothetical protein NPIL_265571 [Nephila pilipes]GFU05372.1 hypothetical protein NPIL_150961 [Nephila pilipes]
MPTSRKPTIPFGVTHSHYAVCSKRERKGVPVSKGPYKKSIEERGVGREERRRQTERKEGIGAKNKHVTKILLQTSEEGWGKGSSIVFMN